MRKKKPHPPQNKKNPWNHMKQIMFSKTVMLMTLHLKYI